MLKSTNFCRTASKNCFKILEGNIATDHSKIFEKTFNKTVHHIKYADIVYDMLQQRRYMINTLSDYAELEELLAIFKNQYIAQNREIRAEIMNKLNIDEFSTKGEDLEEYLSGLDNLIKQGCLPRKTTLYRGCTPYDFGLRGMNCVEFIQRFYKKGKVFKIPIYPETSLDEKIGVEFALSSHQKPKSNEKKFLFVINADKGTPAIYMEDLGVTLQGEFNKEEEVLLARNLLYKFKNYTETENYHKIELDILKRPPLFKKVHEFWKEVPPNYWEK